MAIWREIAADLREAIESGRYAPGDRLPTEDELTQQYGVARSTVRKALAELTAVGLITARPRLGTFVRSQRSHQRDTGDRYDPTGESAIWHEAAQVVADMRLDQQPIDPDAWNTALEQASRALENRARIIRQAAGMVNSGSLSGG